VCYKNERIRKKFTLTKDFESLIKNKILINISQTSNASFARRWDILQEIFPKQKTKIKPGSLKRHHAHFTGEDEPDRKRIKEDDPDELYLL
jgi:hypothetical protein